MIEPIAKTTWICPHCEAEYATYEKALKCANTPVATPRFKAGDTVYVRTNYENESYAFAEVTIAEALNTFSSPGYGVHEPLYLLSQSVRTADYLEIGIPHESEGYYVGRPARQDELLQMGDEFDDGIGDILVVSPEAVTTDF